MQKCENPKTHAKKHIVCNGLIRLNEKILENPVKLECAKNEIYTMMDEIPEGWDPHMKLDHLKVVIRSVVAGLVGRSRRDLKKEIIGLESELNDMKLLKETTSTATSTSTITSKNSHQHTATFTSLDITPPS